MAEPSLPQKPETTPRLQNEGVKRAIAPIFSAQTPTIPTRRCPPTSPVGTDPRTESPIAPLRPPRPTVPPVLHPLSKPAGAPQAQSEAEAPLLPRAQAAQNFGNVPDQPSPKKETARFNILPRPPPPAATVQLPPGAVATSKAIDGFDSIPRWFCWGLLGLSALIFLIQIWNYALS